MLRQLAAWSCIQGVLFFILMHSVTCDCPFPERIFPNGRFLYERRRDVTATTARELYVLKFKCYPGYQRFGPRFIQCIDKKWTDVVPTCAKMQCSDPPAVQNAQYELRSGKELFPTLGSSAIYSCKVGFELNDTSASTLHCVLDVEANNAKWKGEMPQCIEKRRCPEPGVSKHGHKTGSCCFSGDILKYSCETNYTVVGNSEIRCLSNGSWSSARPLCRPLADHCEVPPPIPHGQVVGDKDGDYFQPYDEAEVLCETGYVYRGATKFILCEDEGQWEYEFGECTEAFCDAPEPLANGTILELQATNQTAFPHGFELTYTCDKDFRLVGGDIWRTCMKGNWTGRNPSCEVITCPDPGVPENGDRIGSNFEVGANVRFKCFTGYNLIGSVERYCKPNGQWTGELSRCDTPSNYCPNPGIPINGYKNSTSYDVGDKVGFRCNAGYIQTGSSVRECLANRTWSGTETACLGTYDFDDIAKVRDVLIQMTEEEWGNGSSILGRSLPRNFPGTVILYFAFDVSGSVRQHNFDRSIEFAKAIVSKVGISEDSFLAGALTFSSKAENKFLPLDYKTTDGVLDALGKIEYTGGGTSATSAMSLIMEENIPLVDEHIGKKNTKSFIFIMTDGKANMGGSPEIAAEALKKAGVEIYCIGITGSVEKESLYKIASKTTDSAGEHPNVYILQDYTSLSWLVQQITNGSVDYSQCGLGLDNIGIQKSLGKIGGGKKSQEPWPWMAALYVTGGRSNPSDIKFQCGGTIVHKNFILTAAHCKYDSDWNEINKENIIVKLGLTDVENQTYVQELEVLKIHSHRKYRVGRLYDYDIALIQLDRQIEYNPFVRPICLPPTVLPADSTFYKPNEFGWATGWGHEGIVQAGARVNVKASKVLKELNIQIQSRERCDKSLEDRKTNVTFFTERMFCAGDGKRGNDTCYGDSGGPIMQSHFNADGYMYWTQVGIVSWGIGCGLENTYGFYTHVQKLRPWIDNTIEDALSEV